jgi:hypothetical protein
MDLTAIGVADLKALNEYLLKTGWSMDGLLPNDLASVWHHPDNDDLEILLPATTDIKDYQSRLFDLFATLSEFENRTPKDIYSSVLQPVSKAPNKKSLTHHEVVARVAKWVQRHHSKVVIRDPFRAATDEQPDVIAWRLQCSILIECKVSRSDFLCDKNKAFRKKPEKGMGDWRFYACPPGVINVDDLPDKWGLLWVYPKTVRKIHGWPPNSRWGHIPFEQKNKTAEMTMLVSALRRLELKGYMDTIYDKDYSLSNTAK